MDHQWRPSPTQGNICPVCGISHFPFCPPPPHSFSPNPRFPLPPAHHRPGFDPYHVPPLLPPHPSWRGPNDGLNDYRSRNGSDAYSYEQMPPQYHYAPLPNGHGDSNGFLGAGERNYKRMRVGDMSATENNQSSAVVASADERRLKLIRDHGNLVAAGGYNHETGRFNADAPGVLLPSKDAGFPKNEISWSGMKSQYNGGISRNNFDPSLNEQRGYLPYPSEPSAFNALRSPMTGTPPRTPNSLFPVGVGMPPPYPYAPHNHSTPSNPHQHHRGTNGFSPEDYGVNKQPLPPQKPPPQERKIVDASDIFKMPYRARRPDHFVIILRGLPGSGKSYLAKMLRDLEVENGGSPPRIYSMDDYFMTEVEKVEQYDASNSSSGVRGKRSTMKKVMEYCYEPEMEEAYRASMLKAYKKTLEEGVFTFVIVDDRNLRVADFAQFWAIGKKSGYEVYISEASYKDPEGCAARNVHGFTLDDIHQMVKRWEETPALYLQLDIKSLLHGDNLKGSGIQEVDMEMEDEDDEDPPAIECKKPESSREPSLACDEPRVNSQHGNLSEESVKWDSGAETSTEVVRELGRSKWSDDPERHERTEYLNRPLSGLASAYSGKMGKSVRWGDEVGDTGFSIAAAKKSSKSSLVIGPGAGYNLKSNPLAALEMSGNNSKSVERRRQNVFQERLRAETESFKVVFDKRRHRIGGFEPDDE